MIAYFIKHSDMLMGAFFEHLRIVLITVLLSFALASAVSWLLLKSERATNIVIHFFSVIYSIPSLALFAMLIPVFGLGDSTAYPVLIAYNQYLLIRNIMTGMQNVDKSILEAGTGMGMSRFQLVTKVQIPLAMPSIIAGIRLSVVSTTGIAVIAATINSGGLGKVLLSGLRSMNEYKIAWGTILSMVIALTADLGLKRVEKLTTVYERKR